MKNIGFILLLLTCLNVLTLNAQKANTSMRGLTGLEMTAEMAPGLNLYNTLDAYGNWVSGLDTETCWGNPFTTFEMVESMANRGFKTLRIPVTWNQHLGPAPDYIVDTVWMNRVEEVVNYALDNGMYAIVNIHHDDEHFSPTYAKQEESTDWLVKVWTQISARFKDYGDYLIFETLNEPRELGSPEEWSGGSAEHRAVVNAFNLAIVNIIRNSGGNNAERFIMMPQVTANPGAAMADLIIPEGDTNIIVSVHNYNPWSFCLQEGGPSKWGTASEVKALQDEIKSYSDHFVANGQAVVIGEWGAGDKDNYADRVTYNDIFANACKEEGIAPIAWMYAFNRNKLEWTAPMLEEAMFRAFNENAVKVEEIVLNTEKDTLYVGETLQLSFTVDPVGSVSPTDFIWTSYNKDAATVDENGLVTAVAKGRADIAATVIGASAKCKVIVLDTTTNVKGNTMQNIQVYPNPVKDQLNIELSGINSQIELFTLEGKQVLSLNTNDDHLQINVAEYKQGTYILRIMSKEGIVTKKLVIE